ncbi:hypothetical protein ACFQO8_09880 [Exiguobacterium aestuarii]|uniref:SH3 domain-containing protein n=1 Tax=Exiguobacterium aestuarii TaxID=273527 RepID=A0ABW2PPM7_9BACL|nr:MULTISPECIES: hypothetical protein [Exiguobacterium]MCT4787005.1 hypothetical protein [Exiguobacterium aestuarii]
MNGGRLSRATTRKRKRVFRVTTAVALILALVGIIAFAALIDKKQESALPTSDEIATEMVDSESEQPTDDETKSADKVYIGQPYTKVYADDRVTVVYEADLGDRFERLETVSGFVKVQLNERTSGWVTEESVTTDASALSDDEVIAAWQQVVPNASETVLDWIGKDVATVRAELGSPTAVQRDQVNEYHFYDGFFLMVRDQKVRAIDWDRQAIVSPDVKATSEQATGTWFEGETVQLKLFPYSGVMRVRLESK